MFNLDKALLNLIFPWSNNLFYGFGFYAKLILILVFFYEVFIIFNKKRSVK